MGQTKEKQNLNEDYGQKEEDAGTHKVTDDTKSNENSHSNVDILTDQGETRCKEEEEEANNKRAAKGNCWKGQRAANSVEKERIHYERCKKCDDGDWKEMDDFPCLICAKNWNRWKSDSTAGEGRSRDRERREDPGGGPHEPIGMSSRWNNAKSCMSVRSY